VDGAHAGKANASDRVGITEVREVVRKTQSLRAYNLEVAHAHTFMAGEDGLIAHNGYGAYRLRFDDGTCYVGKGDKDRMERSRRNKEKGKRSNGKGGKRKCIGVPDFLPFNNDEDSFIQEDKWIEEEGGVNNKNSCLLNKINSPGKRMRGR
jgi:hypothetical protein